MNELREDLLAKADEFERMADLAQSQVLRCRYQSLARYWSILAEEADGAALKRHDVAHQQKMMSHAA